jgi:hypothetical protein
MLVPIQSAHKQRVSLSAAATTLRTVALLQMLVLHHYQCRYVWLVCSSVHHVVRLDHKLFN